MQIAKADIAHIKESVDLLTSIDSELRKVANTYAANMLVLAPFVVVKTGCMSSPKLGAGSVVNALVNRPSVAGLTSSTTSCDENISRLLRYINSLCVVLDRSTLAGREPSDRPRPLGRLLIGRRTLVHSRKSWLVVAASRYGQNAHTVQLMPWYMPGRFVFVRPGSLSKHQDGVALILF